MKNYMLVQFLTFIVIASLLAGCGKSPLPSSTQATSGAYAASNPTQAAGEPASSSDKPGACTVLPQEDVSKALGLTVNSSVESTMGGTCTYKTKDLTIDFNFTHTGGKKPMDDLLVKLGDLAIVIPGLGDQAFINTNVNTLFVLKGDAVYLISVVDPNFNLSHEDLQKMEKSIAVQLLENLP